jgi:hypothetical protein
MRSIMGQAVAAGDAVGGRPVLPFARTACMFGTMQCYSKVQNDSVFLSPEAVHAGLAVQKREAVRERESCMLRWIGMHIPDSLLL